jgi:succinate dehydrogenase/fumarate reductase flavoprotein subunit
MVFGARCVDAILSGRDGPERTGALAGLGAAAGGAPPGTSRSGPIAVRKVSECCCGADLGQTPPPTVASSSGAMSAARQRAGLQTAMTNWAGVVRDASSLARALAAVNDCAAGLGPALDRATAEVRNLTDVSRALLEAAGEREETRGSQARSDFPETSPDFLCRLSHGARPGLQPADRTRHEPAVSGA